MPSLPYQTTGHDSIQYHVFADGLIFAARVFRTDTLEHYSAWIHDSSVREVLSSSAPLTQGTSLLLDVSAPMLRIRATEHEGIVSVQTGRIEDSFEIRFKVRHTFQWTYDAETKGEYVLHLPDLDCEVTYRGRTLRGTGYHKRYYWRTPPQYWGYRFLHSVIESGSAVVWTADAMFGTSKYDYFKVLDPETGNLLEAAADSCAHKQNLMFGEIGTDRHRIEFVEAGAWNTILKSPVMDSHMQQRAGRIVYTAGGLTLTGPAITEYCFGTLG
jgi:hypothetical protein